MKDIARTFVFLLFLLLSLNGSNAYAEISCDCGELGCTCFIQMHDDGIAVDHIVDLLADQGYLSTTRIGSFDDRVYEAVCLFQEENRIEITGIMDDETLTMLIWGVSPQSLTQSDPLLVMDVVWVPTDGGKKRHRKATCSGMYDPRKMTVCNAEALGIDACKRCNPQ